MIHTVTCQSELPFPNDSFDFVMVPNSMEFFTDPRLVLREVYRVLKPKGLCLIPFTSQGAYKVSACSPVPTLRPSQGAGLR